jgi:hypothetical protein
MSSIAVSPPAFKVSANFGKPSSLLEALDAASNGPAFLMLSATTIITMLVLAIFGSITTYMATQNMYAGAFFGFLTFVLVTSVAVVGVNATGILLGDGVWGRQQRGLVSAILAAAFTFHRLLSVLMIEVILFVVYLVVLTALLFVCKLPGVGPLLYAVVLPISAIATGLVIFSLLFIAIPLAAPAIWNGSTVKSALVLLQAVARSRLLMTVTMMVIMFILMAFVTAFIFAILFAGVSTVLSLSAAVVGVSSTGMVDLTNIFAGGGASGYAYAMGFGMLVLFLLGGNPAFLIGLKGSSIIYREVSMGLDLAANGQILDSTLANFKEKAERTKQAMNEAAEAARKKIEAHQKPLDSIQAMACHGCKTAITADDLFCGSCGYKQK